MSTSPNEPSKLGGNTEARRIMKGAAAAVLAAFNASYLIEQSTRSQTIGYALLDSPVALAAWMLDHDTDSYYKISRAFLGGPPSGNLTRDHILDNVTLYRLIGTGVLAARSYWESARAQAAAAGQTPPPVTLPVSFSAFPGEISRQSAAGSRSVTQPSCTTASPTGAGTSPPGKNPSCSRARSGRRSGPCANRRQAAARAVRRWFTWRAKWSKPPIITPPWAPCGRSTLAC
jgi:hypothetical protein